MLKKIFINLLQAYQRFRRWRLSLSGKTEQDYHNERLVSGKAWEEFCDTLKASGAAMVHKGAPQDAFNQAEGYRYLTRLTRAALENFVEFSDPGFPVLNRMVHETVKIGADNPDNYYMNAKISGDYEYRIKGNKGTVHYLSFGTQRGDYGKSGGMEPSGLIDATEMTFEDNGDFEIYLSKEQKGKNWLRMTDDTSLVMVRQTFLDKEKETPAAVKIEALGDDIRPRPITPELVDNGLTAAGGFVAGAGLFFANWSQGFQKHTNELPLFDEKKSTAAGGDPNIDYYHSYWKLADDEALLIEVTPPACEFWNFQLNNHWMESLDYRYFNIHINNHTAKYESDGSVRIIIAHDDPNFGNWINTVGHNEGTMLLRWVRAKTKPQPKTTVVKWEDINRKAQ
jgi:hypothetical protein